MDRVQPLSNDVSERTVILTIWRRGAGGAPQLLQYPCPAGQSGSTWKGSHGKHGEQLQFLMRKPWKPSLLADIGVFISSVGLITCARALFSFFFYLTPWSGLQDLSSLIRNWSSVLCSGMQSLNQWTTREVPFSPFFYPFLDSGG